MVVEINKLPNTNSREAKKGNISFEDFSNEINIHREDVKNVLYFLASKLEEAGDKHDWTKKERERQFYDSFTDAKEKGLNFKKDAWYKYHVTTERHHIASHVAKDINLIDVIEMISDCCCAGLARSGKIYDIDIKPDVLMKAFNNTVQLTKDSIKLDED